MKMSLILHISSKNINCIFENSDYISFTILAQRNFANLSHNSHTYQFANSPTNIFLLEIVPQ